MKKIITLTLTALLAFSNLAFSAQQPTIVEIEEQLKGATFAGQVSSEIFHPLDISVNFLPSDETENMEYTAIRDLENLKPVIGLKLKQLIALIALPVLIVPKVKKAKEECAKNGCPTPPNRWIELLGHDESGAYGIVHVPNADPKIEERQLELHSLNLTKESDGTRLRFSIILPGKLPLELNYNLLAI